MASGEAGQPPFRQGCPPASSPACTGSGRCPCHLCSCWTGRLCPAAGARRGACVGAQLAVSRSRASCVLHPMLPHCSGCQQHPDTVAAAHQQARGLLCKLAIRNASAAGGDVWAGWGTLLRRAAGALASRNLRSGPKEAGAKRGRQLRSAIWGAGGMHGRCCAHTDGSCAGPATTLSHR